MDETFLNSEDMARLYKCANAVAFMKRWRTDRLQPSDMRTIPDPIQKKRAREYLWAPGIVRAFLNGERPAVRGRK